MGGSIPWTPNAAPVLFITILIYFHAPTDRHHTCVWKVGKIFIYSGKNSMCLEGAVLKTKQSYNIPLF